MAKNETRTLLTIGDLADHFGAKLNDITGWIRQRGIEPVDYLPFPDHPESLPDDPVKRRGVIQDHEDQRMNTKRTRARYELKDFAGYTHPWAGDSATRLGTSSASLIEQKRAKGVG